MKIKDLYGKEITITDLNEAVKQADQFKGFKHTRQSLEQMLSDEERQRYWTDMYCKLLQLQSGFQHKI